MLEVKKLLKSHQINEEVLKVADDIEDKPLGVVGMTIVSVAGVIKRKYQIVYKVVFDATKELSKVKSY